MEKRNLGKSGLSVSLVGLGCNNFGPRIDRDQSRSVVHKALDAGITLFDTADGYGLNTDWIDLYQLHTYDPLTPIEETLRTLDDLVRQGKVRYIGCSNLSPWRVVEAQWTARVGSYSSFVSCQDEYSLVTRDIETEMTSAMESYGMGLLPYYPLAAGILTGKYKRNAPMPEGARLTNNEKAARRYVTEANLILAEKLEAFAKARDHTLVELAFSWLASRPVVSSIIAGATKPEQVEQNVASAGWKLSADDLAEINRILSGGD